MSEYLATLFKEGHVDGWAKYADEYVGRSDARIVVQVIISQGAPAVEMILDTGTPWNILDPEIAETYGISLENAEKKKIKTSTHGTLHGSIVRLQISIAMSKGKDIVVDSTFFIPDSNSSSDNFPNFIGYDGCLSRVKMIVDPCFNAIGFSMYC